MLSCARDHKLGSWSARASRLARIRHSLGIPTHRLTVISNVFRASWCQISCSVWPVIRHDTPDIYMFCSRYHGPPGLFYILTHPNGGELQRFCSHLTGFLTCSLSRAWNTGTITPAFQILAAMKLLHTAYSLYLCVCLPSGPTASRSSILYFQLHLHDRSLLARRTRSLQS